MATRPGNRLLYTLTLVGYFGILALLIAWYGWLSPPELIPIALALLLLLTPLLFPLRGILHGRRYTFAWSCFLALFYFTHGVMEAYSSETDRYLGLLEITFASLWFVSAMAYIRTGKD